MSQNDFVIDNASFPATRADLTSAFQASASNSSGATAPATTYANMFWYDTGNNFLKMRSEANDAWISIGYLDQTTNEFAILDDTKVVNSGGTQTALLGDQSTATWQAGTSTTESLVSPAKVMAAAKGYTLIGSVATTSGTSVSFSGVDLTSFEYLSVDFDVVSSSESGRLFFGAVGTSTNYATFMGTQTRSGTLQTSLNVGGIVGIAPRIEAQRVSTFRKNTTTLTFSLDAGSFTAGTITVFGLK